MFDENTTDEDVKIMSRMIAGALRNQIFEPIHQHISDDEMGPIQDRMRGCIYEILNGIRITHEPRVGLDLYREHLAKFEQYPIDTTEFEVEATRRTIQGETWVPPTKGRQLEEWEMARARREKAFSRRGPFSCEEE